MKKFFFFAAALMVSAAAMATTEIFTVNQNNYPTEQEVKDKTATMTAVDAGTVLYTGTAFDVKNAFSEQYQRVGLNANAYTTLKMNGSNVIVPDQWGIQAASNPKNANGDPATTGEAPTQGAVFKVDVKADGMIYVFHKASSNKKYTVMEIYNGTETLYGYDFAMITCPANDTVNGKKIPFLAGGVRVADIITDSLITYSPTTDDDNYVQAGTIVFPEIPMLREDVATFGKIADSLDVQKNGAYAHNGLGVIAFPVLANTSYYVNACGSKLSLAAIAFTTEAATITVSNGEKEITLYEGKAPATAVENVEAVKVNKVIENGMLIIEKNGERYNALGQKL